MDEKLVDDIVNGVLHELFFQLLAILHDELNSTYNLSEKYGGQLVGTVLPHSIFALHFIEDFEYLRPWPTCLT